MECKENEEKHQQMTFIEKKQSDDQQPSPSSQKIPSSFYENNQNQLSIQLEVVLNHQTIICIELHIMLMNC